MPKFESDNCNICFIDSFFKHIDFSIFNTIFKAICFRDINIRALFIVDETNISLTFSLTLRLICYKR